jgi:hypothetical protein
MPILSIPGDLFCTDADVAREARGDWPKVAPKPAEMAQGEDGVIAGGARWVLTSASNDFEAQGVIAGHTLIVEGQAVGGTGKLRRPSDILEVDSVSGSSVTLRRLEALIQGQGNPPTEAAGATAIKFFIPTVRSYIDGISKDLGQAFGISAVADLVHQEKLKKACVYGTLAALYLAQSVLADDKKDDWLQKSERYRAMYDSILAFLDAYYGVGVTSTRFAAGTIETPDARPRIGPWPRSWPLGGRWGGISGDGCR